MRRGAAGEQRSAAGKFLDFLMTEPIQKQSLTHGFRPGNPVGVDQGRGQSRSSSTRAFGLRVDLTTSCEPPGAAVIANLLASWQRGSSRCDRGSVRPIGGC